MKNSASGIRNQIFKTKFQGFDKFEVQNFLNDLASEWESIQQEQAGLREKIVELETRLKDYAVMEKAIHETFMQAQETSGRAVENARKEAQLIISEAESKATQILEQSRNDLTTLREHTTILKAKKDSIVNRLKLLLNSELDLIKGLEVDEPVSPEEKAEDRSGEADMKKEIDEIIKNLG